MWWNKKNKAIDETSIASNINRFKTILTSLCSILEISENKYQAEVVGYLIKLLNNREFTFFLKEVNGVKMWGGSGAVWEVYIEDDSIAREFKKNIIDLIDLMEETNIIGKGIKSIRRILRNN